MLYPSIIYRSLIFSCNSCEDLHDRQEDSTIYEDGDIEHGNCSCCTSFAKSAELEKQRELWWKHRRRRRKSVVISAPPDKDLWDPTIDLEDGFGQ